MLKTNSNKKNCTHYWLIEPARTATSFGRCKHCGLVTEFLNDYQLALMKLARKPAK